MAKKQGCIIASMSGERQAIIDELADYVLTIYFGEERAGREQKVITVQN